MKIKKIAGSVVFAIALVLIWQLLYMAGTEWLGLVKSYAVPNPLGVWNSFVRLIMESI